MIAMARSNHIGRAQVFQTIAGTCSAMFLGACSLVAPASPTVAPPPAPTAAAPAGTGAQAPPKPAAPAPTAQPVATGKMTEQGTPRTETLIVDHLDGRVDTPQQFNPYMPGTRFNNGFHQLNMANLYENDGTEGNMLPWVASKLAEQLDASQTRWRINLRQGLFWSDGVELTSDDVVWTLQMLLTNTDLPANKIWTGRVKDVKAADKYTIDVELVQPQSRFEQIFGNPVWDSGLHVLPKHVWEKEDPAKFMNYPPVGLGSYTLKNVDPQGYWTLWERREDWQKTPLGATSGMPKPRYVLFKFYGPEEKRVIAGIQHDLDIFTDITPESWDILHQRNEYAQAWYSSFPWATFDDPCTRGMAFNTSQAPYDNKDVRWALALATDIQSVSQGTFARKLRFSPLQVPALSNMQKVYHQPLLPWLKDFTLADGYSPFDADQALHAGQALTQGGEKGLPSDPEALRPLLGVGWWKYDPAEAAKLLQGAGFTRGGDGKWLLPDGTPWKININAPANFEVESGRLAFAVADSWRKFGVDANAQAMESGSFWNSWATGSFDAGSYWPGCGFRTDVYYDVQGWHQKNVVPTGQSASANQVRYRNEKISSLIDQLEPLKSDDPKVTETIKELVKVYVQEMPWIPMFGTSKFVPVDTYYWKGFPTADNPYYGPWWWWANFNFILPRLEPTGR